MKKIDKRYCEFYGPDHESRENICALTGKPCIAAIGSDYKTENFSFRAASYCPAYNIGETIGKRILREQTKRRTSKLEKMVKS